MALGRSGPFGFIVGYLRGGWRVGFGLAVHGGEACGVDVMVGRVDGREGDVACAVGIVDVADAQAVDEEAV